MLSFFISCMFFVTVLGQATDPTKVCLPDVFQSNFFSLNTHIPGVLAYDFPNSVLGIRTDSGLRAVYNLTDYSVVEINDADGTCQVVAHDDKYKTMGIQCLPATAVLISASIRHIGLVDSDNQFLGWRVPFPGIANVTFAFTTTTPAIPIIREFRVSPDTEPQLIFFFNPRLGVDDRSIFNVPDVCYTATIVG